ncbi:MAG: NADP-dependent malic enzyme [Calditrichae bacterium]|nr:NADP-dependent malic enzyme [Calditrichia bacterium]
MSYKEDSIVYHRSGRPGKIEISVTKPCVTQRDLSLAYTPGVAEPCLRIEKNPDEIFDYTARGNLVAVVSNGTAVLGLGDIGAGAGKPVMEGKGVLFKRFADIDVFDLEIDSHDPDEIIRTVKLLEPTFGGINLEDIKAPECFYIEEELKKQMNIPVFHDDQHGTAIISGAGLINALEISGKKADQLRVIISGAGASAIACANFYISLGVQRKNIMMFDSKGLIYKGRTAGMNPFKEQFAVEHDPITLEEAFRGADMFLGLSVANAISPEMVKGMADHPIIFALANPDPEIAYDVARKARPDALIATGRSDYPNQVNNVLGFPFIFRGALDVRATSINEEMKIAAARALANLTREPVPYSVMKAYKLEHLSFGPDYIIPNPFDPRVLIWEASAVAQAAIDTGVARKPIDINEYKEQLEERLGLSRSVMRVFINRARKAPKRIVFPEGDHDSILKACEIIVDEHMAYPILIGDPAKIRAKMEKMHLNIADRLEIINPMTSERTDQYGEELYELRKRKGLVRQEAQRLIRKLGYFSTMMVHRGEADGLVAGLTQNYADVIRPALQIIGVRPGVQKVAGLYMMILKERIVFFADATVNIEPDADDLAEIALLCAAEVRRLGVEPRIAMVSFSNFGSSRHPLADKVRRAAEIVQNRSKDILVDGEMQADTAVSPSILNELYPFSRLAGSGGANVLIFPNLETSNVAYKLLKQLGGAEAVGPILMGLRKPVHLLQIGDNDEIDVVYMTSIAVMDAQAEQDGMVMPEKLLEMIKR